MQVREKPTTYVFRRSAIEVVPLVVKVLGTPTLAYTIQVQPEGIPEDLDGDWDAPDSLPPDHGYIVNGPELGGGQTGTWYLYVKINDAPLTPIRMPAIIRLV